MLNVTSSSAVKRTVENIDVAGQRALVRVDLNVPLNDAGEITDDRRIQAALPTITKLREGGARVVLMSHLGRPKNDAESRSRLSLAPVARRLGELLSMKVMLLEDCVGSAVGQAVAGMKDGEVILLENLRFHAAETIKDRKAANAPSLRGQKDEFAKQLAELGDVYVNDAFGTCHRDNASMLTVPTLMKGRPRVVGLLVERELRFLGSAVADPKRPFVCILGGAKVSDKIGVIRSLSEKCDAILIGGAMAFTFLAESGLEVGRSLVEPDLFETARELRKLCGNRLHLPVDTIAASGMSDADGAVAVEGSIPTTMMGLDIGPRTIAEYGGIIERAKTVLWNGPMGVFESPPFDKGTLAVGRSMSTATRGGATTIVGGGDSAAAIRQAGLEEGVSHISTGGGASLEFLEGKPFAAIGVLDNVQS